MSVFVTGIGASAGGLEALEIFFRAAPTDGGIAFVVITHLDPTHPSMLVEIMQRWTSMPVATIHDGVPVESDHVYVLPPDALATIRDGKLHLRKPTSGNRERTPVDIFFTSLAENQKENAAGVVLSGGGSDGSHGIMSLKEHGGLTIAQGSDGTGPGFKDMPDSAVATGLIDVVLPAEEIANRLVTYARTLGEFPIPEAEPGALRDIYRLLSTSLGHDFSEYKTNTFVRRMWRRMQALQVPSVDAYRKRLEDDPAEAKLLFRELLIRVTDFFRDPEAFLAIETEVIPKLFERKGADNELRVWVPACATGEEAYSIAILLHAQMQKLASPPKVQLFASDIDEQSMKFARAGVYSPTLLGNVSPARLERYFTVELDEYRVKKEIRDLCIFSPHSLTRDPPFSRLDLISCRNLLIYLQPDLQARAMHIFHYAIKPGGYLFLGLAENISRHDDLFSTVDKTNRIFQRLDRSNASIAHLRWFRGNEISTVNGERERRASSRPNILELAAARVAATFTPAYVVVNRQGEILHYSAGTGRYLEAAAGPPNRDIFTMARGQLRIDLRGALREAGETRKTISYEGSSVEFNGVEQSVNLTIDPIFDGGDTVFLIVFNNAGPVRIKSEALASEHALATDTVSAERIERELLETRERLQSTIEELETSNEELKSSNEELMSVNEELQSSNEEMETSKEEIQTVNEELQTVNAELGRKVELLDRANSDLRNLLESMQVGAIFLDRNLIIRSFTVAAREVFNLVRSDEGRSLTDIVHKLDEQNLEKDLRQVLSEQKPIEKRVVASNGSAHYFMRIFPYRALDRTIGGVLLTFVNITSVIAAEKLERELTAELSHRVKNTLTIVNSIASQTARRSSSLENFLQGFLGRIHALAFAHDLLAQTSWTDASLDDLIRVELEPFVENTPRLTIEGPHVALKPRATVTLGMVFHELATNAIKYGAFSVPDGKLSITWKVKELGSSVRLELRWLESGGPTVEGPSNHGFGHDFIERAVAYDLEGEARLEFPASGLRCVISLPIETKLLTVE